MHDYERPDTITGAMERNAKAQAEKLPAREMYWSELPLEAKVERLRDVLRILAGQIDIAGATAAEAHNIVMNHEHHAIKGIMRPAYGPNTISSSASPFWHDVKHMVKAKLD